MAHRLAEQMGGFDTEVIALDVPGATRFDDASALAVRRVGATRLPRSSRTALLNTAAFAEALKFRPDVSFSVHIVMSPAAAALRRARGTPFAQYFHAEEIGARPKLAAFAAAHADELIANSAYTAGLVTAAAATRAGVTLIPPGVDLPRDPIPDRASQTERPTILTVARLQERYKGHDVLVRALPLVRAKVPGAHWVVIGDGSLRAGIEQLARAYRVEDSVSFLGAISDEQRNSWLARAHVLAMPSRLPAGRFAGEGFGIVYLEAGAYGKPVVAGNVAGALDAVVDGETGLLADPLDPLQVAEAISGLLRAPELARRLGEAGRRRARGFAWPIIAGRLEQVLLGLAGSERGAGSRAAPGDLR
jgi:phosphatidyl-myo-inositol dimannoside synthase